jgi:hypothetical protein
MTTSLHARVAKRELTQAHDRGAGSLPLDPMHANREIDFVIAKVREFFRG